MISTHSSTYARSTAGANGRMSLMLGLCLLALAGTTFAEQKPDIVLIVADDLGYGDLGCYGSGEILSPAIDSLAKEGMKWTNFYANCCVCSPTRASILTGCYPDRVGVPGVIRTHANNSWGKLAQVEMLPQNLKAVGYQTSCIGKWHLGLETGDHPLDRGFDHFAGFLGDMMDDYYTHLRHQNNYMQIDRKQINPAGHATRLFADWATKSVEEMSSKESPYFLYLAFNAPHTPIQPPPQALAKVQSRLPNIDPKRARLIALIEDMDTAISRVMAAVKATGRDTLVAFVSDNGGQLNVGANNGGLRDGKQSNYEGGLRIPAIFHWPGKISPGSECKAVGVTMDLLPTILELVGGASHASIDGKSLTTWLKTPEAAQEDREVYFVRREGGTRYCGLTIEALRSGQWKLVHNFPTSKFELFDLLNDPKEEIDLAQKEPAKMREMMNRLMLHIQAGGQVPWQPIR